jgi:hypothetical protein
MSPELPDYISRDGELLAIPPIKLGTTLYMFMLDADYDALQAVCDRYLNLGGETVYKPLLPAVMLYCSRVDNFPVVDPIGWCPEMDFGFWIPVAAGKVRGKDWIPERALAFTPYLWVDNGVALIGGRTVFGFMKEIGVMTMPATTGDPALFTIDTQVVPHYGPTSQVVTKRLWEVHKTSGGLWDELKQLWSGGVNLLDAIAEILQKHGPGSVPVLTPEFILTLLSDVGRRLPMVFLKEFPDAADGRKACYQAIIEAGVDITSDIQGGWLGGEYAATIWRYDSHRIVEKLGLKPVDVDGNRAVVKSLFHGWVKFDAVVKNGTIIWQRP